jgi:integrase
MKGVPVPGHPNIKSFPDGRFGVDLYLKHPVTKKRDRRIKRICESLEAAIQLRDELKALNTLQRLPKRESEKVTIGQMYELRKAVMEDNASWSDSERIFLRLLEYFGRDRTLESIDEVVLQYFIRDFRNRISPQTKKPYSNKYVWHHLQHLLSLLRMAHRKNLIPCIPEFKFKKDFGKREITVDFESYLRALKFLPTAPEPDRAMAYMALFTGQRLGDLRSMTWDQVNDTLIQYRSSKTARDDLQIANVPEELIEELESLKPFATSEVIFANPLTGKAYSPNAIRRHLKDACDRAGVEHFTPHQIRHLATVTGLELSGDADLVQRWIGWLTPEMIRTTYGHVGNRLDRLMTNLAERMRAVCDDMPTPPTTSPQATPQKPSIHSPEPLPENVVSFRNRVSQRKANLR